RLPGARRARSSRGTRRSRSRRTRRIASGSCSAMSGGLSCSGWGDGNAERGTRKSEQAFQFRVPTSAFRVSPLVYRPHALLPSYRGPAAAGRPDRDHARLGDDHALVGEDRVRDAARRHRIPAGRALEERRAGGGVGGVRRAHTGDIGGGGEHAGTLFDPGYFYLGKAYVAQAGQLYVEAAAAAPGKVYCFGATFRAEKSKTRRHLAGFWLVGAEVGSNGSDANMRRQEECVS